MLFRSLRDQFEIVGMEPQHALIIGAGQHRGGAGSPHGEHFGIERKRGKARFAERGDRGDELLAQLLGLLGVEPGQGQFDFRAVMVFSRGGLLGFMLGLGAARSAALVVGQGQRIAGRRRGGGTGRKARIAGEPDRSSQLSER